MIDLVTLLRTDIKSDSSVIEWVLAEGYDLMNTRVSGGIGYLSGTGTGRECFLGIIFR